MKRAFATWIVREMVERSESQQLSGISIKCIRFMYTEVGCSIVSNLVTYVSYLQCRGNTVPKSLLLSCRDTGPCPLALRGDEY